MSKKLWALPLAATLALTACSGDGDATATPTSTVTESGTPAGSSAEPSSQTQTSIDVDSDGDPSADAQDAEGLASLGTAVATIEVQLPAGWQYEGTYGDGSLPYAVLVDSSQPFDLSEPGSDAYLNSVWVQVETYAVDGESPYGTTVPRDADEFAKQIAEQSGGEAQTFSAGDLPLIHVRYDNDEGARADDLLALHGDVWILARPTNVNVDAYLDQLRDGSTDDGILRAVLETSQIK